MDKVTPQSKVLQKYKNIYTGRVLNVVGYTYDGYVIGYLDGEKVLSEYGTAHYEKYRREEDGN